MRLIDDRQGTVPLMALMALPFVRTSLWVLDCFLGAICTRERLFEESFELDRKETLSVDSDLNKNTSLWWTKIGLP